MNLHPVLEEVTQRVVERSRPAREDYLERMRAALEHVIHDCEHAPGAPRCPIIEAIDPGATEA